MDKGLGIFDPSDSGYHSKHMSEKEVDRVVTPVCVVWPGEIGLKEAFQPQGFAKLLKQEQSSVAS